MLENSHNRPVFVVSSGRSGSQMLARVLGLHPEICAFHEPRPMMNTEAYLAWAERQPWCGPSIEESVRRKRARLVEEICDRNGFIYVESSHFCSHLIPVLEDLFRPKYIHLFRDGKSFVTSGPSRDWYGPPSPKSILSSYFRRRFLLQVGNSYEDHRLSPPRAMRSRLERIAWLWNEINVSIMNHLSRIPADRKMRLQLETFDRASLQRVLRFIGVDTSEGILQAMVDIACTKPNRTSGGGAISFTDWPMSDKVSFERIAGATMSELGYSDG